MSKALASTEDDDLRPEYDLSKLRGGRRGKYYQRATAGTNLVLIEPDLAAAFPDQDSVNLALRLLVNAANAAGIHSHHGRSMPHKRLKRTAGKRGR